MRNYIKYIIDYSDGNLSGKNRKWFEKRLLKDSKLRESFKLFKVAKKTMRGSFDAEEAKHDPDRVSVDPMTYQMVLQFHQNPSQYAHIQQFVENALVDCDCEELLQLDNIQREAEVLNINIITTEWVAEWNAKNQALDLGLRSRRAFIRNSLSDVWRSSNERMKKQSRTFAIKVAGFAAAATIAIFLLAKTLILPDSPESVYHEFYKPLSRYNISSLRESDINDVVTFIGAVEMYKQAQYNAAAVDFSGLLLRTPRNITFCFFSGITQLELGQYDQAISQLNEVITNNGEYKKEAQWYLGLTYLKAGETSKARSIFNELSEAEGYYKDQAQDLLNHLK